MTMVVHPSVDERAARGKAAREQLPPSGHAGWTPAAGRPDPVALLEEQNPTREPDLVPVRHGRMVVSPFTFYRGAAKIMAADLKDTPTAGLNVQLCGDAHLSNFGVFASPERTLLFDLNDFDETLPGPFEYDVKRMAASFTIAARNNGFTKADARDATVASVTAYREAMAEFAEMGTLDVWYAHLSEEELMRAIKHRGREREEGRRKKRWQGRREGAEKAAQKAHTRDSLQALSKLAEIVDGRYRIVSQPPIVVPLARPCSQHRSLGRRDREIDPRPVPRLPGDACRMIGASCSSASRSSTWPARSWASAASARGRSSCCSRGVTNRTRCSCRSRRRPRRCWRTTSRRAATGSPASGSCRVSG